MKCSTIRLATRVALHRPIDIAAALGVSESVLWKLARGAESHYHPPSRERVGKKVRVLDKPKHSFKRFLRLLHEWLQAQQLAHFSAHGGVRSRSCVTHARAHIGQAFVWNRDAADCFPSCRPSVLRRQLRWLGFRSDMALLLTLLLTVRGRIPQGSPTSNDALNLLLWHLDEELTRFCAANNLTYGRVSDDFVVSGDDRGHGEEAVRIIELRLSDLGIHINEAKRDRSGFQPSSKVQLIHSIVVNDQNGPRIYPEHADAALTCATVYVRACRSAQPGSMDAIAKKRGELCGWIAYARQLRGGNLSHLTRLLRQGDRLLRTQGLCVRA